MCIQALNEEMAMWWSWSVGRAGIAWEGARRGMRRTCELRNSCVVLCTYIDYFHLLYLESNQRPDV